MTHNLISMRSMTIEQMQASAHAIANPKSLRTYLTVLNTVNDAMGWDRGVIWFDLLIQHKDQICDVLKAKYKISNLKTLKNKLNAISSLMTRTRFEETDHDFKQMIRLLDTQPLTFTDKPNTEVIPKWLELKAKLKDVGQGCSSVTTIVAKIFSYDYVLRVNELFDTRLVDDGQFNYLDLDNCQWTIRMQKNGKFIKFEVNPDLCQELKPLTAGRAWLLCKQDGNPYGVTARCLSYHKWCLPENRIIRKSYETWNMIDSGRDLIEVKKWNEILGHSHLTAKDFYVVKPEPEPPKPESLKPKLKVDIKLKPKPKIKVDIKLKPKTKPKPKIVLKRRNGVCVNEHDLVTTSCDPYRTNTICRNCRYNIITIDVTDGSAWW